MKILVTALLLMLSVGAYTQESQIDVSVCDNIKLKEGEDYKEAEPCIKLCTQILLSKSYKKYGEAENLLVAVVLAWMDGSPDHTFTLTEKSMSLFVGKGKKFLPVYMVCLAQAAIESGDDIEKRGMEKFVEYARNPANKVKSKAIKQLLLDADAGKLDMYIES